MINVPAVNHPASLIDWQNLSNRRERGDRGEKKENSLLNVADLGDLVAEVLRPYNLKNDA